MTTSQEAHQDMNEPDQQPLKFLHLSDIHFRREVSGGVYDPDNDLRNELERDAEREVRTKPHRIDGILVTGDIAFAGIKDEFDVASGLVGKDLRFARLQP